jgi:hypothetical protein
MTSLFILVNAGAWEKGMLSTVTKFELDLDDVINQISPASFLTHVAFKKLTTLGKMCHFNNHQENYQNPLLAIFSPALV